MFDVRDEPAIGAFLDPALVRLPGLALLQTYLRGPYERAPIAHLTGMQPISASAGAARSAMPLSSWLSSSRGTVDDGALLVPADSALGSAIHTTLPEATLYITAELSLTWTAAVAPGGTVTAEARAVHSTATAGSSTVQVVDDGGAVLAHGSTRCRVFPPSSDLPASATWVGDATETRPEAVDPYLRPVEGAAVPAETWQRCSGREILSAQLHRELPVPPLYHLFGLTMLQVDESAVTFSLPCTRWVAGPLGNLQGGVIGLLAHTALQGAIQTTCTSGYDVAPLDLMVHLVRPVLPDGRDLVARGLVTHQGGSYAIATAEVTNAEAKRVALATGSGAYVRTPRLPEGTHNLG